VTDTVHVDNPETLVRAFRSHLNPALAFADLPCFAGETTRLVGIAKPRRTAIQPGPLTRNSTYIERG
jgi:hypothetical protein